MADLRTTLLKRPSLCPSCGHTLDAATSADRTQPDATPSPGDWNVCINCAVLLVFKEDLTCRAVTAEELQKAIAEHPELQTEIARTKLAIAMAHATLGAPADLNPRSRRH